jgi:hypothetical protein
MPIPRITIADVDRARKTYESNEPRDLFYKAATELVSLAIGGQTSLTLSDAIAVLLQTWNREYYRFRKFDTQHYTDIDNLLSSNRSSLLICRSKKIQDLEEADSNSITGVFVFFEKVLGPQRRQTSACTFKTAVLLPPRKSFSTSFSIISFPQTGHFSNGIIVTFSFLSN